MPHYQLFLNEKNKDSIPTLSIVTWDRSDPRTLLENSSLNNNKIINESEENPSDTRWSITLNLSTINDCNELKNILDSGDVEYTLDYTSGNSVEKRCPIDRAVGFLKNNSIIASTFPKKTIQYSQPYIKAIINTTNNTLSITIPRGMDGRQMLIDCGFKNLGGDRLNTQMGTNDQTVILNLESSDQAGLREFGTQNQHSIINLDKYNQKVGEWVDQRTGLTGVFTGITTGVKNIFK